MNCPSVEILREYLEESIGITEAEAISGHVDACRHCQGVLDRLTGTPAAEKANDVDETPAFLSELKRAGLLYAQVNPDRPDAAGVDTPLPTTARAAVWPEVAGYEILDQLGRGGMGVVYKARHVALDRLVALKMLVAGPHALERDLARFRTEAEAAARLQHPNIVQIYDIGESEGRPYLALELVDGGSMAARIRGEPQPVVPSVHLVETLARAIHFAHQHGIVHRDLKPSNILLAGVKGQGAGAKEEPVSALSLLTPDPWPLTPKITDFGLAKRLGGLEAWTQTGEVVGTPGYMAPEQATDKGQPIGPAADVYALGAVLYELLTGRPPFKAGTVFDTVLQVLHEGPVPPSRLRPKLPRDVQTICLKCLDKTPRRRYASAAALADDLHRFAQGQAIQARPAGALERGWKWVKRCPTLTALMALLGIVAMVGFPGMTVLWLQAEQERQAKERASQRADRERAKADRERGKAEDARKQAHSEAAIAKAVNDFLQLDLLAQASPDSQPDRALTVRAALDRAAQKITGRFDEQPVVEAAIRSVIGETYQSLGEFVAAEAHLVRSLELCNRALGEEDLKTICAMNDLGCLRRLQGDYAAAEPLLVKALERMRQSYGAQKEALAPMINLALLYRRQHNYAQAEPLLLEAVDIGRRLHGEEHPKTLDSMLSLAAVLMDQSKYAEAESLLVRVLEARRRRREQECPQTLTTLETLAQLFVMQGKYKRAEQLFVELLDTRRRVQGEEHPDTLTTLTNLSVTYVAQKNYTAAEPLMLKTLEARRRLQRDEHPDTLNALHNLAMVYGGQGKYAEAEPLLLKTLEMQRRRLGPNASLVALTLIDLGQNLIEQQRYADAEPILREGLEIYEQNHPDNWHRFEAQVLLGGSLGGQGKSAEAERLLLAGYEGMKARAEAMPAPAKVHLRHALNSIIGFYEAWGKPEQAARWRAKRAEKSLVAPAQQSTAAVSTKSG